nr:MAG TPA: hypothetical protein [Caudoviricetes sp.]
MIIKLIERLYGKRSKLYRILADTREEKQTT